MKRLRAYLELMRLSNLPTVWTNALVGLYAGVAANAATTGQAPPYSAAELLLLVVTQGAVLIVALSCLYAGGMALNDVLDEAADRVERPGRPIPSGRISAYRARLVAATLLLLGVVGLAGYQTRVLACGLLLLLAIVVYNALHRRWAGVVVFMGLCRGMVYFVAAAAPPSDERWWLFALPFAAAAFVYVMLLTIVSRLEVGTALGRARWAAPLMIPVALAPALFVQPAADGWVFALVAAALLVFWISRGVLHAMATPPRTPRAITTWLSGICLLDAWFLTLLGQPLPAAVCVVCWAVTALGHRRIAGT